MYCYLFKAHLLLAMAGNGNKMEAHYPDTIVNSLSQVAPLPCKHAHLPALQVRFNWCYVLFLMLFVPILDGGVMVYHHKPRYDQVDYYIHPAIDLLRN